MTTVQAQPWFYRLILSIAVPIVRRWGRLRVTGEQLLDRPGPILVVGNHDSYWDPVVVGIAALGHRQIRAMAKSTLWRARLLAWVLNGMGQLKITRGTADRTELAAITTVLRAGGCVGIFPEGRISKGRKLRAYSGAGWLARSVPQTRVVAVAITGAVELVRFPRRPEIMVEFFEPIGGQWQPGESSIRFARRITAEIRDRAPAAASGRRPISQLDLAY
jgi:1-acyl-sn-glycerol-3-phosphate acyltransferase